MCYGVAQRHGGAIEIESTVGVGTTITLRLPVGASDRSGGQANAPSVSPAEAPRHALRILLVDDEPQVRAATAALLAAEGHEVTEAAGGAVALAYLAAELFDLVVTDRAMPDVNGQQVAAEVKRIQPAVPVILLTGFGDVMGAMNERLPDVELVLSKPAERAHLRRAIADVVARATPPA
jgi:CheY-like chemotaxis protein